MFRLGEACRKLWRHWQATKKVDEIGKGKTVVCMMPDGSLAALVATNMAKTLEIELLKKVITDQVWSRLEEEFQLDMLTQLIKTRSGRPCPLIRIPGLPLF